jgi:hypothetical protein
MNDMSLLCKHTIATSGGLWQVGLADLNQTLRRNINSSGEALSELAPARVDR